MRILPRTPERVGPVTGVALLAPVLLALAVSSPAGAQELDDPLSPGGHLRVGASAFLTTWESRYGTRMEDEVRIEEEEPLGFDLTHDRLGADGFPAILSLQDALRTAASDPTLGLSLGRTRARIQATTVRIPIQVDLGITDWLTVGATVPFLRQRTEVGLVHSADATTADLGLAPETGSGTATETFLQDVADAVSEMQGRADATCSSDPDSADCQTARSAAEEGERFLDGVSAGYASALFPFEGSSAGGSLRSRLGTLGNRFARHGVTSLPPPGAMPLAQAPLTAGEFQQVLIQSRFGVSADSLATWQSPWEIGDVELHGALRLLEGTRPDAEGWSIGSWLLGVGGRVRLGTGRIDDPDRFLDRGSGDGQRDLEGRVFADLGVGRRLGLWADVRYGIQLEGMVTRRISPPDVVLAPVSHRTVTRWDPGDYLDLEVAPRLRLTPELALAARYRYHEKESDRYAPAPGSDPAPGVPPVGVLDAETGQTLHETGISLVYSTLRATEAGLFGRPVEARIRYRRAVAGGGGKTPVANRVEVGLRTFLTLWGG